MKVLIAICIPICFPYFSILRYPSVLPTCPTLLTGCPAYFPMCFSSMFDRLPLSPQNVIHLFQKLFTYVDVPMVLPWFSHIFPWFCHGFPIFFPPSWNDSPTFSEQRTSGLRLSHFKASLLRCEVLSFCKAVEALQGAVYIAGWWLVVVTMINLW